MRVRRCILVLSGYHSRVFAVVFCCDFLSYSKGRKYSWNITDREVGIFYTCNRSNRYYHASSIDTMNGLKKKSHCLSAINRILKV